MGLVVWRAVSTEGGYVDEVAANPRLVSVSVGGYRGSPHSTGHHCTARAVRPQPLSHCAPRTPAMRVREG